MAGESEDNKLNSYSPKNETGTASSEINLDSLRKKVRKYIDMVRKYLNLRKQNLLRRKQKM